MSNAQVVDGAALERARDQAKTDAVREKQAAAVADAESKRTAALAPDGEIDMTDVVAQAGRRLERAVIQSRLRQLNPGLRFERSIADPTKQGIYLGSQFLCGMEWEASPEFTVKFSGTNERTGQTELLHTVRGWREVLATLIRKRVIEAERAIKLFDVYQGRESSNWAKVMH